MQDRPQLAGGKGCSEVGRVVDADHDDVVAMNAKSEQEDEDEQKD